MILIFFYRYKLYFLRKTRSFSKKEEIKKLGESKIFKIINIFQTRPTKKIDVAIVYEDNPEFYIQNMEENIKLFNFLHNYNNNKNFTFSIMGTSQQENDDVVLKNIYFFTFSLITKLYLSNN